MGGIVDPERGALIYRKTTQVETVEPEAGSEFTQKKIKKITSETSWIGHSDKEALVKATEQEEEVKPWHDEEIEANPLYSSTDYASDFKNPLYTNRQSTAESVGDTGADSTDIALEQLKGGQGSSHQPADEYADYIGTVDTLF